jgi:hypothetical protein
VKQKKLNEKQKKRENRLECALRSYSAYQPQPVLECKWYPIPQRVISTTTKVVHYIGNSVPFGTYSATGKTMLLSTLTLERKKENS